VAGQSVGRKDGWERAGWEMERGGVGEHSWFLTEVVLFYIRRCNLHFL